MVWDAFEIRIEYLFERWRLSCALERASSGIRSAGMNRNRKYNQFDQNKRDFRSSILDYRSFCYLHDLHSFHSLHFTSPLNTLINARVAALRKHSSSDNHQMDPSRVLEPSRGNLNPIGLGRDSFGAAASSVRPILSLID